MTKRYEKDDTMSYETKIKRYKKKSRIITVTVVLFAIAIAAFLINAYFNKTYNSYKVISKIERADSNTVKYISYGENMLKYSRDGASVIDGVGGLIWNGTYEMKEPSADICGDYVAIGDIGSKDLYVFDNVGKTTKLEMLHPIMEVEVASQGVTAVVLDDKDQNYINIIDAKNNKEIVNIKTIVQKNGYPVDISISEDGKKLVTSYLSVSNGIVESKVSFYNFGAVGQSEIDRIVGGFDYHQTIVPKVDFIDNNTVCAYGDDKFTIYSMKEKPSKIYEETFKSEIKSTFSNERYIGFVLKNTEDEKKYQVVVYDLKGKKVLDQNVDYDYNQVLISKNEILFYSDLEWFILKTNGKEKLHHRFKTNISYIMPANQYNRYFIIDQTNINHIKLIKE